MIVFDLGNVLIRWDPRAAFRHAFDDDAAIDALFDEVGFHDWHHRQDCGRSRADAVAAIAAHWPQHAGLMDGFFDRFGLTISDKMPGSWEILAELRGRGHTVWALTNWGPDTWGAAQPLHPELGTMFDGIVVSGHEGLAKPDRRIFDLFCSRAGVEPAECFFTDDSAANVAAARKAGWQAHRFEGAEGLRGALCERGLL
ncbi:HAD-IA family hydrolase [Roseovarius sp. D22-M7]|uniref:HAD-IA family hydrolase n=1 Tax=Roseovarius sp. D22-M7 TaxID=3127116 RepID=UPI00300FDADF